MPSQAGLATTAAITEPNEGSTKPGESPGTMLATTPEEPKVTPLESGEASSTAQAQANPFVMAQRSSRKPVPPPSQKAKK